ncbi:glycosyltransferase [Vibrio vulnificus]|uniref:glycosyltransferase family 2 protein n=1 Tax=Vibrio vulnificus TaxID=672 RepID=UPI0010334912|nr:glycosyltransferase family 2 protein [Vibrio vulnificus]EHU5196724.1 glycosyltransferase family 2 protein [Vibrio vulnificus]ELI0348334.1 glycosyltransferase family 2 protein [Vibrio vulnificus]MCU8303964.1 glycosyltransferase [Vibrio vulnificus]MVT22037.1 glycosyltransferase [Vibrio vulnificus]QBH28375.1 Beta-1,3-glucosyltransferase [Vibrio vulnificus]
MKTKYNEKVSVILPVFNASKYIEDAINSVLRQSYKNFEFIIINDGSTDDSSIILNDLAGKDSRIKLYERENKGLIYTLNEALSYCKGEFIARMDADDICSPCRLMKQLQYFESNPNVDVLGSWVNVFGANNTIYKYFENDRVIKESLVRGIGSGFAHPTVMFKRKIIEQLGYNLYDEKYKHAEDIALWMKLSKNFVFSNIQEALLMYRIHNENVSILHQEQQKHSKQAAIEDFNLIKSMSTISFMIERLHLKYF